MAGLVKRELSRFIKSPAVCLNAGFGILIMLFLTVVSLIKTEALRERVTDLLTRAGFGSILPVAAVVIICFVLTMDCMTASSVSLEGEGLHALVTEHGARNVLWAKGTAQVILNAPFAVVTLIALGIVIRSSSSETALMAAVSVLFTAVLAAFGLMMNIKKPMLKWEHEAVPMKQGFSVMYTMVFGWAWVLLFAAGGRLISGFVTTVQLFLIFIGLLTAALLLIVFRLRSKGEDELEALK